jgi:uncharacterized membrane protein
VTWGRRCGGRRGGFKRRGGSNGRLGSSILFRIDDLRQRGPILTARHLGAVTVLWALKGWQAWAGAAVNLCGGALFMTVITVIMVTATVVFALSEFFKSLAQNFKKKKKSLAQKWPEAIVHFVKEDFKDCLIKFMLNS